MSDAPTLHTQPTAAAAYAEYEWLVSDAAEPFLTGIALEADPLAAARLLRGKLSVERVHLVLEQVRLRARARKKFTLADKMFFTPIGLEQATDEWVAAYKASRFAGAESVVDFCCGIGGDLMSLARRGPVVGVDRDPVAALLAQANCGRLQNEAESLRAQPWATAVETCEVAEYALTAESLWHIDPDRRATGRRTTQAEFHDPPAAAIDTLRTRSAHGAIKLAPAAEVSDAWSQEAELEWISFSRQCRQLVVWFGRLVTAAGQRRATIVDRQGIAARSLVGRAAIETPSAARIGRYVFEPDAAVLAANLTGALAAELHLESIAPGAVYLTGDQAIRDAAAAGFEVLDVVPFDVKRLKKILRAGGFGRLEVKKRGVEHDPAAVAKQLKVPGDHAATLLIARLGKPVVAILARRLERASS
jgi:SAM-dependent methyltransferase